MHIFALQKATNKTGKYASLPFGITPHKNKKANLPESKSAFISNYSYLSNLEVRADFFGSLFHFFGRQIDVGFDVFHKRPQRMQIEIAQHLFPRFQQFFMLKSRHFGIRNGQFFE